MASGHGVDPAGYARAGMDLVRVPERHLLKPVQAKRYDPQTRAFAINVDGQYENAHPVDQRVVLQLVIVQGAIPSVPDHGNPALRHRHISADHVARVKQDIEQRLAPMVAAGEIQLISVTVDTSINATFIDVAWSNLLTGNNEKARL